MRISLELFLSPLSVTERGSHSLFRVLFSFALLAREGCGVRLRRDRILRESGLQLGGHGRSFDHARPRQSGEARHAHRPPQEEKRGTSGGPAKGDAGKKKKKKKDMGVASLTEGESRRREKRRKKGTGKTYTRHFPRRKWGYRYLQLFRCIDSCPPQQPPSYGPTPNCTGNVQDRPRTSASILHSLKGLFLRERVSVYIGAGETSVGHSGSLCGMCTSL